MNGVIVKAANLAKVFHVPNGPRTAIGVARTLLDGGSLTTPRRVIDDVSFLISKSEKVALIGTNGSGKTTLLRLIAGIFNPSGGALEVATLPRALFKLRTGMHSNLSVEENVFVLGAIYGIDRRHLTPRLSEILELGELEAHRHAPLRSLSAGEAQRLAFSVLSFTEDEFLMFDETFSAIDEPFLAKHDPILRRLMGASRTVIVTGHNREFLERYCTSAIWLERGKIRALGALEEVFRAYYD